LFSFHCLSILRFKKRKQYFYKHKEIC